MNKNLLIIGAGQYGYVAKETAEAIGNYDKISFIDNNSQIAIGKTDELDPFVREYAQAFVAIGNSKIRLELIERLEAIGYHVITLIHPKAYVSPSAKIEKGCIVEPNAVVQANANVELGCLISAGAVVNHNAVLEKGCHIDFNATVAENTLVPTGTKVGCGVVYKRDELNPKIFLSTLKDGKNTLCQSQLSP